MDQNRKKPTQVWNPIPNSKMMCPKQISRAATNNCIPHILWDEITWPCPVYMLRSQTSPIDVRVRPKWIQARPVYVINGLHLYKNPEQCILRGPYQTTAPPFHNAIMEESITTSSRDAALRAAMHRGDPSRPAYTLRSKENEHYFPVDIFKCIFFYESLSWW